MVEASTAITLEDIVNQYTNLGTRFESGLNQQKSDVNSSANRTSYEGIFDETVLQNLAFVPATLKFPTCVANEDIRKQYAERNRKSEGRASLRELTNGQSGDRINRQLEEGYGEERKHAEDSPRTRYKNLQKAEEEMEAAS
ncbi:hypothetical protein ACTXT7_010214 [Hymenolepis weldensis]